MKALSIRQPWAWAILNAGKDIENRDWRSDFRGVIAVHASKSVTKLEYEDARDFMIAHIGVDVANKLSESTLAFGAIIGTVEIVDCVDWSPSQWAVGSYCFVLSNPKPLIKPVLCKGALGLWDVPAEILSQIKEQR